MSNKNPYSVVYLMGGFGNQLFQLCFANNLRKKGHIVSIDSTNYRYGRSTLSLASAGVNKKWNMRRDHSSKIDTADFHSLPTIKAI